MGGIIMFVTTCIFLLKWFVFIPEIFCSFYYQRYDICSIYKEVCLCDLKPTFVQSVFVLYLLLKSLDP